MDKRWAIIDGFDGAYRVSDAGDVESCHVPGAKRRGGWRPLTVAIDKYGYPLTYLWDSSRKARVRIHVHRIVALHFVGNPMGFDCIDHLNGIKTDLRPSNLEWCTRQENMRRAWANGLCRAPKLSTHEVMEILSGSLNDTMTAAIYGVSQVLVTKIRAGKVWKSEYAAFIRMSAERNQNKSADQMAE